MYQYRIKVVYDDKYRKSVVSALGITRNSAIEARNCLNGIVFFGTRPTD